MAQVRAVHGAVLELIVFPPTSNSCNICEAILKDRFANSNESKKRADLNLLRILSTWCVRMCEAVDLLLQGKLYNLNLEAGQSTKLLGTLSNETIDLDTDLDGSTLRLTVSKSLKSGSASGSPTWNSLELMLPNSSIKGLTAHLYQSNFHRFDDNPPEYHNIVFFCFQINFFSINFYHPSKVARGSSSYEKCLAQACHTPPGSVSLMWVLWKVWVWCTPVWVPSEGG